MDEIRRQLAELMDSVETSKSSRKSFTDADVCKYYLTGLCPHELFQNTKQYLGECPKIHSEDLREHYVEARQKANYGYEEMTIRYLKPHIDDCDRRIARQTIGVGKSKYNREGDRLSMKRFLSREARNFGGRCDTQDKASESIEASAKREVDALEVQIATKMREAEELGNRGDVEGSIKLMDEINQLNVKKKHALEEKSSKVEDAKNMYFQKLRPCEACGALLSEKDGENRLNEHFLGRIHLGFEAIRKHVKELDEYIAQAASRLPRDSAYNCRPSTASAPIRSDSMDDHRHRRSSDDHHNGPSSDYYHHHHHPHFHHRKEYHRDENGKHPYRSRYGAKGDSHHGESPSRHHYQQHRDDHPNRRDGKPDERFKQSTCRYHSISRDHFKDRYCSAREYQKGDSWREGGKTGSGYQSEGAATNDDGKDRERDERPHRSLDGKKRENNRDSYQHSRSRSRDRSSKTKRRKHRSPSVEGRQSVKPISDKQVKREIQTGSRAESEEEEEGQIDQK